MNGWIILDKPSGITSAHAVAKVKRLLKPKKLGHAGTLDPLASGVLPLALGEATKTMPYMVDAHKAYSFTVTWGEERDTDDSEGKAVKASQKRPGRGEIEAILPQFTGTILQTPPAYSAIRVDGKRAYDLARGGQQVELKAREITVNSLEIIEYSQNSTSFICHCTKGTYIRGLARDMGRVLGCLGYISALRRLRVGKFDETHAISLEVLEKEMYKGDLGFLWGIESALDDIPAVTLTETEAIRMQRGQNVVLPLDADSSTMIARCNGKLVAICEWENGCLKPKRVFNL
jgi:tRNA pseudouridine55 synthase